MAVPRPIVVALGLAAAVGCRCEREPAQGPPPPPVEVAEVEVGDVPELFPTIGMVESINTVQVRARVGGHLIAVEFEPGSVVEVGQPLFRLDPRPFERALEAAEASLAEARTRAAQLRADARRYRELERRGAVATQQAEQTAAQAQAAAAAVEAAAAAVEQARLELGFTVVEAPVAGRTGELAVRIGDLVQPNFADPLVTIQVMDPIYVRFSLPADLLPAVREAMRAGQATVRAQPRGHPDRAREGRLDFIDNTVDPATGTILLKAVFDNAEETFWPGEPTEVWLHVRTWEEVPVVPSAALQVGPEGPFVFVVRPEDSTVEMRAVRPGPADGGRLAIVEGLAPGERVVVSGQLRLRPGMEVRVAEREPAGPTPVPDEAAPPEGAP